MPFLHVDNETSDQSARHFARVKWINVGEKMSMNLLI